MNEYRVLFYIDSRTRKIPVETYIDALDVKVAAKVLKYINFLREHNGYLDEPYSKHIRGNIRELRVDFARDQHRIFYFTFVGKAIILLHAFAKKTSKTPPREIHIAIEHYNDVLANSRLYE